MAGASPDLLGQAVGPIVKQLETREQMVLLAVLERQAAETYRRLAREAPQPEAEQGLMGAADHEDSIADILEKLDPDYKRIEDDLLARFPQLRGLFGSVLNGRPYEEQMRLQQVAELGAAALFKSLAHSQPDEHARQRLLDCAGIEQANAAFLATQLK